jgi:hypothetical protein
MFCGFFVSDSWADINNTAAITANTTVTTYANNNNTRYALDAANTTISTSTTTSKSNVFVPSTAFSTTHAGQEKNEAWDSALNGVFSMLSKSNPVSNNEICRKSIQDLMIRQNIPQTIAEIRKLDDVSLYKLAMLASVGGMSRWGRDGSLLSITEDGHLIHPYSPGAVESDVMLCVICALLTVIATFHLIPPYHTQNSAAGTTTNKIKNVSLQPQPTQKSSGGLSVAVTAVPTPTAVGNYKNQFYHTP